MPYQQNNQKTNRKSYTPQFKFDRAVETIKIGSLSEISRKYGDIFGQMVYGYCLAKTMDAGIAIKSLNQAVGKIKKLIKRLPRKLRQHNKPLFHQDQGSQYTSYQYVEAGLKFGTLSYSTPGTPTENPGQESFFGRFKQEWADEIRELESFEEVQKFVAKKIRYYNCQRLHTSIGFMSPVKFTKLSLSAGSKWFSRFRT